MKYFSSIIVAVASASVATAHYSNQTTTSTPPAPTLDACASACLSKYNTCNAATGANHAVCASDYADCLGYAPVSPDGSVTIASTCSFASTTTAPPPGPTLDACAAKCLKKREECDTADGANHSFCASKYSECLGYAPLAKDGSLTTGTTCAATTTTAPPPGPTLDACAATCLTKWQQCDAADGANHSLCASNYASCLGYAPVAKDGSVTTGTTCAPTTTPTPSPTPDACAADCLAKWKACDAAPGANHAECASQYTACLGYAPIGPDGSIETALTCASPVTITSGTTVYTTVCPVTSLYTKSHSTYTTTYITTSTITYCAGGCGVKTTTAPPPPPPVTTQAPPPPGPSTTPCGSVTTVYVTIDLCTTTTLQPAPSTTTTTAKTCPTTLGGAYQYPHLIVPVDSTSPDSAYGTQYNGRISSTVSSIFNFDIPSSYTGLCSLVFLFPTQDKLQTSSYTFSGDGKVSFSKLKTTASVSTTYNSVGASDSLGDFTVTPGSSTVISTFACPAGQAISFEMGSVSGTALEYFQDYNPSPIGLYVTAC